MNRRRLTTAAAVALALALLAGGPVGCLQKGGQPVAPKKGAKATSSKNEAGALSSKEKESAAKTIRTALLKNAKGPADTKSEPVAPLQVPAMDYAIADTVRLAAIMGDIQLTPEPYYYASSDRRDIFEPLVRGSGKSADESGGFSIRDLRVVGILWAEHDRFALVEAPDGTCRILREGDQLGDGIVERVFPDRVILRVTEYGSSRNITLPLVQGGDFNESPRSRGR